MGEGHIVCADLPQDLRCVDKQQDDDFQRIGQVNVQFTLQHGRQGKQDQGEKAEKYIFKIPIEKLGQHHQDHRDAQKRVKDHHGLLFFPQVAQCFAYTGLARFHRQLLCAFLGALRGSLYSSVKSLGSSSGSTCRCGTRISGS